MLLLSNLEPHLIPAAGGLLGTRCVLAVSWQVSFNDGGGHTTWVQYQYQALQYTGAANHATQDYPSIFVNGGTVHISHYRVECAGPCREAAVQDCGKPSSTSSAAPASFFLAATRG